MTSSSVRGRGGAPRRSAVGRPGRGRLALAAALAVGCLTAPAAVAAQVPAPDAATSSSQAPDVPGGWGWPLDGWPRVTRGFHLGAHRWDAGHRGVDLAGRPGDRVSAAATGVVVFSAVLAGRGVLVVDHGAVRTTYEPVRAGSPVGTRVTRGDAVAVLVSGHAGCPEPACLHWGMLRGRDYLDPLTAVRVRLRLLPVGPHGEVVADSADPVSAGRQSAVRGMPSHGGRWHDLGPGPAGAGGAVIGTAMAWWIVRRRW